MAHAFGEDGVDKHIMLFKKVRKAALNKKKRGQNNFTSGPKVSTIWRLYIMVFP